MVLSCLEVYHGVEQCFGLQHTAAARVKSLQRREVVLECYTGTVRVRKNPRLEVLGVVLTSVDRRTNLWREVLDVITRAVPSRDFQTMISQAIEVAKAAGQGKTVFQTRYGTKHEVADQSQS